MNSPPRCIMNLYTKIIEIIIPIIVIGSFAAPLLLSYTTGEDTHLYYDDYFQTDAVNASGSLELVTDNGATYAHAKDVGDGTLTYSDGKTKTYTVEKAKLIVLYLTGQSNSAYNAQYAQVDIANEDLAPISNGKAYYYGTSTLPIQGTDILKADPNGPWDFSNYSMQSMTEEDGSYKIGHIEAALASVICNSTDSKLYVVNGGQNGRSIIAWVGSGNGMTLDLAILDHALNAINPNYYTPQLAGYIWLQGEADYDKSKEWYIEEFTNVNQTFNDNSLTPAYIIQVNKSAWPNPANAQETIAETIDNVYMASMASQTFTVENGLLWPDSTSHYTQKGYNIVGVETARVILEHNPDWTPLNEDLLSSFIPAIIVLMIVSVVMATKVLLTKTD